MSEWLVRLTRRVGQDFPPGRAEEVLAQIAVIPETLPLADAQDAERLQSSVVLAAGGDYALFLDLLRLIQSDWRDALVAADLAHDDWPDKLDIALGP